MVVSPDPNLPVADERGSREAQYSIETYLQRQPGLPAAMERASGAPASPAEETKTE
jgi:hypothetical protein